MSNKKENYMEQSALTETNNMISIYWVSYEFNYLYLKLILILINISEKKCVQRDVC